MKIIKFNEIEIKNEKKIEIIRVLLENKNNKIEYYFNNKKIENVLKLRNYLKENYNINLYEIINTF